MLQALLVTFLWSTSWVLIKWGLKDIPALTFAGLRYTLAFVCLLPFALQPAPRRALTGLPAGGWGRLALLGVLYYAVTQGAQFVGLAYLPAVTVSILLNFTGPLVALLGIVFLDERPSRLQWSGMAVFLGGVLLYFSPGLGGAPAAGPADGVSGRLLGMVVMALGTLANAVSAVLGRAVNRSGTLGPLPVTVSSMGVGAMVLLAGGALAQGLPRLPLSAWLVIAWLAVVNTAAAFTLWNHTLRTLPAMESTIINSTMLVQIALLAWLFLGEQLSLLQAVGMALVAAGAVLVQLRRLPRRAGG